MEHAIVRPDILTRSGNYFDFLTPSQESIVITDIAHALAHICRFNGHTKRFYSVAQHSVLVSEIVPFEHALAALLHDAAEAYVGDVTRPLKQLIPDYKTIEKRVEHAISRKFSIPVVQNPSIKHADLVLLATEQRDLMAAHDDQWALIAGIEPLAMTIKPMDPDRAYTAFMLRFRELTSK